MYYKAKYIRTYISIYMLHNVFLYAVNYCRHIISNYTDGYIVEITNHVIINGLIGVETISEGENLTIQVGTAYKSHALLTPYLPL